MDLVHLDGTSLLTMKRFGIHFEGHDFVATVGGLTRWG